MASSFKIKLKLGPKASGASPTDSPVMDGASSPAGTSTPLRASSAAASDSMAGGDQGEEEEEEDELDELSGNEDGGEEKHEAVSVVAGAGRGRARGRGRGGAAPGRGGKTKAADDADGQPSLKKQKTGAASAKTRGVPGPGRGWRKGLKMGQKPVYKAAGDETEVAEGTPASFARGGSAEASSSTTPAPPAAKKPAAAASGTSTPKAKPAPTLTAAQQASKQQYLYNYGSGVRYPAIPGARQVAPVGPIARIPIGFVNSQPLVKSTSQPARKWRRGKREVLTIGGRVWSTNQAWYSDEAPKFQTQAEIAAQAAQAAKKGAVREGQETPGAEGQGGEGSTPTKVKAEDKGGAAAKVGAVTTAPPAPSPARTPASKPGPASASSAAAAASGINIDWKGSSPAFARAQGK